MAIDPATAMMILNIGSKLLGGDKDKEKQGPQAPGLIMPQNVGQFQPQQMAPVNLGMPDPTVGMVDSMGQVGRIDGQPGGLPITNPELPSQVAATHPEGKFNFTQMLQGMDNMMQAQEGAPAPPQAPGLLMPDTGGIPPFQVSPLSGLFGLHRGMR